jgi:hypothetical protein
MITDEELIGHIQATLRAATSDLDPRPDLLAKLHEQLASGDPGSKPRTHWWLPGIGSVLTALGSAGAVAVAVFAIIGFGHTRQAPQSASTTVPGDARELASMLGVLRRHQTVADRSLPGWLLRQAASLPAHPPLASRVPQLTRLVARLQGRKLFILVYRHDGFRGSQANPLSGKADDGVGLLSVSRSGAAFAGDTPATAIWQNMRPGCLDDTQYTIVPDGIRRVRWVFARQDQLGFVYRSPLTVDVRVRNNVAVARIIGRAPCVRPSLVSWYTADGHRVQSTGNLANINKITRRARHGQIWGP